MVNNIANNEFFRILCCHVEGCRGAFIPVKGFQQRYMGLSLTPSDKFFYGTNCTYRFFISDEYVCDEIWSLPEGTQFMLRALTNLGGWIAPQNIVTHSILGKSIVGW
jgi:hypothetical protein